MTTPAYTDYDYIVISDGSDAMAREAEALQVAANIAAGLPTVPGSSERERALGAPAYYALQDASPFGGPLPWGYVLAPDSPIACDLVEEPAVAASCDLMAGGVVALRVEATEAGTAGNRLEVSVTDRVEEPLSAVFASGTSPPTVTASGIPVTGGASYRIEITTGGTLASGLARFRWTSNAGAAVPTWTSGVTVAASVVLGTTGITVTFSGVGTYATDNVYVWSAGFAQCVIRARLGAFEEQTIAIASHDSATFGVGPHNEPRSLRLIGRSSSPAGTWKIPDAIGFTHLAGGAGGSFASITQRLDRARRLPAAASLIQQIDGCRAQLVAAFNARHAT